MTLRTIEIPDQLASQLEDYAAALVGVDLNTLASALLTKEFYEIAAEIEANPGGIRRILLGRYLDLPQCVRTALQSSPAGSV